MSRFKKIAARYPTHPCAPCGKNPTTIYYKNENSF